MSTSIENICFDKHPMRTLASDLRSLISPLAHQYQINHFGYHKADSHGKRINLTTHPEFSEFFIKEKLYRDAFTDTFDKYQPGYYLWDFLECREIFKKAEEHSGLAHGLIMIRRHVDNTEFFYFATDSQNKGINNFYINNLNLFDGFCDYFKDAGRQILDEAHKHMLIYPTYDDKTTLTSFNHVIPNKFQKIEKFASVTDKLSTREKEYANNLTLGLSIKEIARIMNISPRTAEKHHENIKNKLQVSSNKKLLIRLLGSKN
ncbi:MAG: helix-turn-helix transcriptional regulator [Proteobacteria bacterium]|nr:helix-turn-helix transcriptional regulator [Pseudomonadota bacterium]